MKTIRVAHVFWGLGFGGIETMLVNIANAQAEYGIILPPNWTPAFC